MQLAMGAKTSKDINHQDRIKAIVNIDASALEATLVAINDRLTGLEVSSRNSRKVHVACVGRVRTRRYTYPWRL